MASTGWKDQCSRCSVGLVVFLVIQSFFVKVEAKSMDELIKDAAETSLAMDFVVDNSTVLVEMDILYTREQYEAIQANRREAGITRKKRNAIHSQRWTNKQIPYSLPGRVFSVAETNEIKKAMNDYHTYSCLRFRPANSRDNNRIYFQNGGGCSSYVGMLGNGAQPVTLARGCRVKGIIIHELGHAIGFHHEQTRPDRDNSVQINYQNIQRSAAFNFQRYTWSTIKNYGVPYDYLSVMHYGEKAFSTNGRRTIIAKDSRYQTVMGNRAGFSFRDVKLVNMMYNCAQSCPKKSCPGEGFVGKDCKCWCPGNPAKHCDSGKEIGGGTGGGGGGTGGGGTGGGGGGGGTGGGGTGGGNTCVDKNSNCQYYSSSGYCNNARYKAWMSTHCKKSCRLCGGGGGGGGSVCADRDRYCGYYRNQGYCRSAVYGVWMRRNCAKSCNACSASDVGNGEEIEPEVDEDACVDQDDNCPIWASNNECELNPKYMLVNCKVSCDRCGDKDTVINESNCVDKNTDCQYWANTGECLKNPSYMHVNCKLACGICSA